MFALYGIVLVLHHDTRLLHNPDAIGRARRAFERLLDTHRAPSARVRTPKPHERSISSQN